MAILLCSPEISDFIYLSFPTTSSKSLNATPNLASTGNLQAIKIVSVAVVAVFSILPFVWGCFILDVISFMHSDSM